MKLIHVPTVIYACFVLHNFCDMSNLIIEEDLVKAHIAEFHEKDDCQAHKADSIYSFDIDEGELVREVITDYMKYGFPDNL